LFVRSEDLGYNLRRFSFKFESLADLEEI